MTLLHFLRNCYAQMMGLNIVLCFYERRRQDELNELGMCVSKKKNMSTVSNKLYSDINSV